MKTDLIDRFSKMLTMRKSYGGGYFVPCHNPSHLLVFTPVIVHLR